MLIPELKCLELNAMENAQKWKVYEESEDFRTVYVRKTPEQRTKTLNAERKRENSFDDEEQCTVEPPKI